MKIILASKSPRRQELLEMLGFEDFIVIPAGDAEAVKAGLTPEDTVCEIALRKARSVKLRTRGDNLIIAADTLVYLAGTCLGKPENKQDAKRMLMSLSGKKHTVYTGVAVIRGDRELCSAEASDVYFRELDESEVEAYIATGEPMDKAGAYAAQGLGALFVRRIEGDFFNVMGLPICRLGLMLKEFNLGVL